MRQLLRWTTVGAVLVAVALGTGGASQAQGENPCAAADALREAKETEEARKLYVRILRRDPGEGGDCAKRGLATINAETKAEPAKSCEAADNFLRDGDLAKAAGEYKKLGASTECAATGLKTISEVQTLCAQGDALADRDRDDDALEAYKSALAKSPGADCAENGVKETSKDETSWLEDFTDVAVDWLSVIVLALAWVVLIGLIALTPARFKVFRRGYLGVPGLRWIVRPFVRPRLTINTFEDSTDKKVGPAMVARIKERLERLRQEAEKLEEEGLDLDLSLSTEDVADLVSSDAAFENALAKASEVSDHTKVVAAIISLMLLLVPSRKLTLSGVIEPASPDGAALVMSFEDGSKQTAAVRLSGPATPAGPEISDILALSNPGAVWVQYEVARAWKNEKNDRAEVFALVRNGMDCQLREDSLGATRFYERALDLDPNNRTAIVNLAMVQAHETADLPLAIAILGSALEQIRTTA